MVHGCGAAERPLPPGLALDARARLVAGDHLARTHLLRDPLGRLSDGLADAGKHIGDGALRKGEAEEALADLGQPFVADHLAAVQVRDDRRDAGTERRALGHVGGRACRHARLAARAGGAEQLDARHNRLDRWDIDVIVRFRELLPDLAEHGAARTPLGVEAARRIRAFGKRARDAGAAFARRPGRLRPGVRLLPARRRQRGVVRRLGGLAKLGFELGHTSEELLVLNEQLVDPRQQLLHQRLQAVGIERIDLLGRHPELESARTFSFNPLRVSHAAAEG
jgi:hypothetical protein